MNISYNTFVHLLFISIIALFPVVNPIGSAFLVSPYFSDLEADEKKRAVKKITWYAFSICVVALFAGRYILELFGLSIPVIQLGGGLMICKMGWGFLSASDKEDDQKVSAPNKDTPLHSIDNKLFYPITFPITTGGGTISVLFTLSAHSVRTNYVEYLENTGAILLAVILMCIMIYFFYNNTKTILNFLGTKGEMVIKQISAFLIFCVGLQIAVSGIMTLIKG